MSSEPLRGREPLEPAAAADAPVCSEPLRGTRTPGPRRWLAALLDRVGGWLQDRAYQLDPEPPPVPAQVTATWAAADQARRAMARARAAHADGDHDAMRQAIADYNAAVAQVEVRP